MQRWITAATVGALLLTVPACSGGSDPRTGAESPSASAPALASASPVPSAEPSKDSASTKKFCSGVDKTLYGKEMSRFADEVGKMIAYKNAKQTAKAKQARIAAGKQLNAVAKAMRTQTSTAKEAELRAAGEEAADNIDKSAEDPAFYAKIKNDKSMDEVLQSEMTPWIVPLAKFCR